MQLKEFAVLSPFLAVVIVLAITVAVIIALIAGLAAGLLARADGASLSAVVGRAGMTFTATLTLLALVVTTVADLLQ
ncbi:hypothetical protein [Streptomyces albogriseolus]|uniref:hypothetical protein n=1 Tax=Streptomyces albogriseolus TaxID=1887 RepID=UPI003461640C